MWILLCPVTSDKFHLYGPKKIPALQGFFFYNQRIIEYVCI